jgi:hypothetical protein
LQRTKPQQRELLPRLLPREERSVTRRLRAPHELQKRSLLLAAP